MQWSVSAFVVMLIGLVLTASATPAENNCIRRSRTSLTCEDYRRPSSKKAAARVADRPEITNRREAPQFLFWLAGQIAGGLDLAAEED